MSGESNFFNAHIRSRTGAMGVFRERSLWIRLASGVTRMGCYIHQGLGMHCLLAYSIFMAAPLLCWDGRGFIENVVLLMKIPSVTAADTGLNMVFLKCWL